MEFADGAIFSLPHTATTGTSIAVASARSMVRVPSFHAMRQTPWATASTVPRASDGASAVTATRTGAAEEAAPRAKLGRVSAAAGASAAGARPAPRSRGAFVRRLACVGARATLAPLFHESPRSRPRPRRRRSARRPRGRSAPSAWGPWPGSRRRRRSVLHISSALMGSSLLSRLYTSQHWPSSIKPRRPRRPAAAPRPTTRRPTSPGP